MCADQHGFLVCPYDATHRMHPKRFQSHLIKCRLNYPEKEVLKCLFNQSHLVLEPEFETHLKNCPGRSIMVQYKYNEHEILDDMKHMPIVCEDNWDDADAEDYDPKKYSESVNILRTPVGNSATERKEFVKKERERLKTINETQTSNNSQETLNYFHDTKKSRSLSPQSTPTYTVGNYQLMEYVNEF